MRCHIPGRESAAVGFLGEFQLWCGVVGLILDISGHQVSVGEPGKLFLIPNLAGCTLLNGCLFMGITHCHE